VGAGAAGAVVGADAAAGIALLAAVDCSLGTAGGGALAEHETQVAAKKPMIARCMTAPSPPC
jgi:hypothetical protein